MSQRGSTAYDAARAERDSHLRGLLMSASRYVQGYADNSANHPQARDGALSLLAQIKIATGQQD